MDWAKWQSLPQLHGISPRVLQELLDGGQSFRWNRLPEKMDLWQGVFGRVAIQIQQQADGEVYFRQPVGEEADIAILQYFGAEVNWDEIVNKLPWRSDAYLQECIENFTGLRILRQPFGETLFGFLCSTAKQITQIKQCCEQVAKAFGPELIEGVYGWPDWNVLAEVPEADLRKCKLGYRAKYIAAVSRILAQDPQFEQKVLNSDYEPARQLLMSLPGVGEKVADCVLLFGAGKLEAFPVDTWMIKVMSRIYQLENWDSGKVAHFGRVHFGSAAGLAQQFLFARERQISV